MESVLARLPRSSRVAVLRLRSLGDCVLSTPALHLLKRGRPDLRLAVAVEERFRAVYQGNPDVDELLDPTPGAVRGFAPALCWNLHGGTRSAWATALSGARFRAGFAHFPYAFVYNVRIPRAQEILGEERTVHTAEHAASAAFHLGAPICETPRARLFATPDPEFAHCAALHPAASLPEKTWPAERFLELAGALRGHGFEPLFLGGPGDDLTPFEGYRRLAGAPLERVKSALAAAALFVGNDSGPAHMAAAFGVPCVVLFGPSDPAVWGPWRTAGAALARREGIDRIGVSEVLDALDRVGARA